MHAEEKKETLVFLLLEMEPKDWKFSLHMNADMSPATTHGCQSCHILGYFDKACLFRL